MSSEFSFPPLSCNTEYASTWVQSIPTSYIRTTSTISSVASTATQTATVYVTDTDATVTTTLTQYTEASPFVTTVVTLPVTTLVISATISSTIATLVSTTTVCTNGPAPSSTVTTYEGSYTPIPGQDTVLPSSYEASDTCWFTEVEVLHIFPTIQGPTITTTIPFTTASPTIIITQTFTTTVTTYASTVTTHTTALSADVVYTVATLTTSCAPLPTVTFAARCAPQNLIAEMSGVGLAIGTFNANFTFGGVAGMAGGEPSLCCQLCVDNAG